jgi:hypothetical protein
MGLGNVKIYIERSDMLTGFICVRIGTSHVYPSTCYEVQEVGVEVLVNSLKDKFPHIRKSVPVIFYDHCECTFFGKLSTSRVQEDVVVS